MIIQCEKCETTYRFDSARLQNGEAQVRCIRCGNVFTVDSLSDLGEDFLNTEAAGKKQKSLDQEVSPASVPADTFADTADEQTSSPFDSPSDIPAPPPDFTLDSHADEDHEEEDFWTSPSEFSFDSSETDTDTTAKHLTSGDESDQPPESDPNEFIFEPLEEDENIAGMSEKAQEHPAKEPDSAPSSGSHSKKRPKAKKKGSKALLIVLIIILIGAGIYAYYFVAHGVTSVPQLILKAEQQIDQLLNPEPEAPEPAISIRSGDNFYISNERLGSLFVINGSVTNISNQPQGEIAVKATLYSSDGRNLRSSKIFCGNPITREELRSESWESLQERMSNKLGAGLSNVSVQPGESIPFCAVFRELPEDFAEFSISSAEASAASASK
ncbi:MAG: DUF3426 domain-containing protein [Desulfuromonadaceae bacterium]